MEIYRRAVAVDPTISLSTVYRTMKLLEGFGAIHRHAFEGGPSRFENASGEHHDHLIDIETGDVDRVQVRPHRAAAERDRARARLRHRPPPARALRPQAQGRLTQRPRLTNASGSRQSSPAPHGRDRDSRQRYGQQDTGWKMENADIGLIGLGVMGSNLALNIAEKGHRIAVFNRTPSRTDAFVDKRRRAQGPHRAVPHASPSSPRRSGRRGRSSSWCRPASRSTSRSRCCGRVLSGHDIIIDAGNANFRDTMRRFAELAGSGLTFIGMGVSGGEEGARHGPSIMVGGTRESYASASSSILTAISAKYQGRALLRLARRRRRRAFRQDHPQRHRICRHADDRRDLRRAARRPRHGSRRRSARSSPTGTRAGSTPT